MSLPPFSQLLDEHAVALHRFCVAQAGPHAGADCYQEAVLAALRAYPDLRDGTNLKGWLFTIAARKVVDHHRATARRAVPVAAVPDAARDAAPADGELWAAVAALPDKQRMAIALRYLGDLPYAAIAAALGSSEAAARQNVRAGLAGLRQEVTR